ncbi:MAG TPA: 2-hydroxyacid dehydrogenase [Acidobacteriaceae bacterium]|nr:2-hydroxyacid dehydrogenase [Acidobacteriaceae bacterium]
MLKVGLSSLIDPALHSLLPAGISLELIPSHPSRELEVEFWIAPPWTSHCERQWPWLRGVRVVQATVAGVEALLRMLPRGVTLCDGRGIHTISTAEWAVTAVLASLKYLPFYDDLRRSGIWSRRKEAEDRYRTLHTTDRRFYPVVLNEELHRQHVLIVGYGSIGQAIEERLRPFGPAVTRVARAARPGVHAVSELPSLLPAADIVILTVPGTSETTGLIGEREIALMKQGALLVNAARGSVVDTDALVAALQSNRIRAALDVTEPEPLPDGHPLWSAPNLLLTPHIASSTPAFMVRAMELAAAQVGRYLRGEPLENVVTGEY